jgi:hypothetical protein
VEDATHWPLGKQQTDPAAPLSQNGARPVAVFVLGFGRSGTSALTRVISLSGAALPAGLLGASKENRRGSWEPRAVVHLTQAILWRYASSAYDLKLRVEDDAAFDAEEKAAWIAKIKAYMGTLPRAPLVVIKEPKMTALIGMWFEGARQAGFDVAAVIAVRHPEEVMESLAKRARRQIYVQDSPELSSAWWLKYTLLAERDTRGVPRVFVEYGSLLEDWRREVKRIAAALAVDLDTSDDSAIEEFLTSDLRHHRYYGPVAEPFGTDWIRTVYQALNAASSDESFDESALDRVFEEYGSAERGFRKAFGDSRRYLNMNRLILRPALVKLGLAAYARAHRRRGTWA